MPDQNDGAAASSRDDAPAPLLARVESRVDAARLPLAQAVSAAMLGRLPEEKLEATDLDALGDQIAEAFGLFDAREPGELSIRVADAASAFHGQPVTVVDVCVEDRPFLLSTIVGELDQRGYQVVLRLHPILGVERGSDGRLRRIGSARGAEQRDTLIHLVLDRQLTAGQRRELEAALRHVLEDVIRATGDYPPMRAHVERVAAALRGYAATGAAGGDAAEAAALLDWLLGDNFLLLGSCEYDVAHGEEGEPALKIRRRPRLGILADGATEASALVEADPAPPPGRLLTVARSHRTSSVHRRTRLINVWVEELDEQGHGRGLFQLVGLFARQAAAEPSGRIPVLRRKLTRVLEREQVVADSHHERTFVALFEAIPKEELFEVDADQLHRLLLTLFTADDQPDVRMEVRLDRRTATATVVVSVPRDRYDAVLRQRLEQLVRQRFAGREVEVELSLADRPRAILWLAVHLPEGALPDVHASELEEEVRVLCRGWDDRLRDALVARFDDADASRIFREVGARLPAAYRDHAPVEEAVDDVAALDDLLRGDGDLGVRVHDDPHHPRRLTRVKLLKAGPGVQLSAILPILESLGLTVSEEQPFTLEDDGPELHIHDYGVHDGAGSIDVAAHGTRLAEAILAAWNGRLEVDSLNRLVLRAELDWPWVTLLRAYRRYRRQIGTVYTADYQNDILTRYPQVGRGLVDLFDARFNPDRTAPPEEQEAARQRVLEACEAVERLDEDRVVRGFLGLIDATLRTNRYAPGGNEHLALKFDSAAVPGMPTAVPYREIFVSSRGVEGIHLRGGPVARGGIRWSDRRDDFRAEMLGLMRTQILKNAVIVPTGAKGGFVLKQPPTSDLAAEIRRQYGEFIRAVLEVTDNIVDGEVVAPPGVRRVDGDDPYLVVAADRGTTELSDFANAIADEHGFWLGDSFAAGGSQGYDHKRLGITARGVWAAVCRHFRELRIDVDTEPVTVVGIGDMSGDVFGNSVLQSRTIRLVAAFDHRDIFLDPDPDPETAYTERRRLFAHPQATWQDYDREALSGGGGVWSRSDKRIALSKKARELLRVDDEQLPPPELIRVILTAPVDLLFAGGIGTFVRASFEPDEDIADRVNDEVRIDASDLRARVYAEGANLSITPRARVQYARRGGRINTDFVDNSAGVNLSDHEVTLKILLRDAIQRGDIDEVERDRLLEEVRPDVVAACLRDVDQQTWVLTQDTASSPASMGTFETLIAHLEATGRLDRYVEAVPSTGEMEKRGQRGAGLTRPELAVLMAAAKRDLSTDLAASALPDQAALRSALADYFPPPLRERFDDLLDQHRLRRELVATIVANDVVNHMGVTFVHRLARELGADRAEVVAAYWIAREAAQVRRYWDAVEQVQSGGHLELALAVKGQVDTLLETLTREYLRSAEFHDLAVVIGRDQPAFSELERMLAGEQAAPRPTSRELVDAGVEPELARRLAVTPELDIAPDVASVARSVESDVGSVADAFLAVGKALGFARLHRLLDAVDPTDRWTRWQRRGLVDDLRAVHRLAVDRAMVEHPDVAGAAAVDRLIETRRDAIAHANWVARQAEDDPNAPQLDALSVAVRAIRDALRSADRHP